MAKAFATWASGHNEWSKIFRDKTEYLPQTHGRGQSSGAINYLLDHLNSERVTSANVVFVPFIFFALRHIDLGLCSLCHTVLSAIARVFIKTLSTFHSTGHSQMRALHRHRHDILHDNLHYRKIYKQPNTSATSRRKHADKTPNQLRSPRVHHNSTYGYECPKPSRPQFYQESCPSHGLLLLALISRDAATTARCPVPPLLRHYVTAHRQPKARCDGDIKIQH